MELDQLPNLNLPQYQFSFKKDSSNNNLIFDNIRKKNLILTPEEWVRQNYVQYLVQEKKVPKGLIGIEKQVVVNKMNKRCDIVVFDKSGNPLLLVECKSVKEGLTQKVFDQIARYNMALNVKYLVVTNGLDHYYCIIEHEAKSYHFIEELPKFDSL